MNKVPSTSSSMQQPATDDKSFCLSLLQDLLSFLVMFLLAILILWLFFLLANDAAQVQTIPIPRVEKPAPVRYCLWPDQWCRILFNCPRHPVWPESTTKDAVAAALQTGSEAQNEIRVSPNSMERMQQMPKPSS